MTENNPAPPASYAPDGTRLTDCCSAYSTYDEVGTLYCKACFEWVPTGQGDGSEHKADEGGARHHGA